MTHKIFVYGTLRPGVSEPVMVPGQMFDLGWFPGVVGVPDEPVGPMFFAENEVEHFFMAEIIEVDDETLARLDSYEGYNPNHPASSLYVRKAYQDGFIYQYNGNVSGKLPVPTGDWLEYTQMTEGCNASHFARR
jgi:gamma-glutamylcyclotransferase (GGCT)/AIG2-like uncharacterized protein YtfP